MNKLCIAFTSSYFETVKILINIIELRDEYTRGHSEHVANLVGLIYENSPDKIKKKLSKNLLIKAALLHDIGKISVPEKLLMKKGRLTDEEYEIIKRHTVTGEKLLKTSKVFKTITPWIKYHHERVDGKGYYGLSSEEIPLESKIIAVADTYSAITTNRVYRSKKTNLEAIEILKEVAGTQLDKEVVDIFLKINYSDLKRCRFHIKNDFYKYSKKINLELNKV